MRKAIRTRMERAASNNGQFQVLGKTAKNTRHSLGDDGEVLAAAWLRTKGFGVERQPYNSPFDLLVNDSVRVEVKTADFRETDGDGFAWGWNFNIHRHGVVEESGVDAYILRLEPGKSDFVFGVRAMHLIMAAPLGIPSISISARSLLMNYSRHFNALDVLRAVRHA